MNEIGSTTSSHSLVPFSSPTSSNGLMNDLRELQAVVDNQQSQIAQRDNRIAELERRLLGPLQQNQRIEPVIQTSEIPSGPDVAGRVSDFASRRRAQYEALRQEHSQLTQLFNYRRTEETLRQEPAASSSSRLLSDSTRTTNYQAASSSNQSQGMYQQHPLEQPLSEKSRPSTVDSKTFEASEDEQPINLLQRQEMDNAVGSQLSIYSAAPALTPQIESNSPFSTETNQINNARYINSQSICIYTAPPLLISISGLLIFYKAEKDGWINVITSLRDGLIPTLWIVGVASILITLYNYIKPRQYITQSTVNNIA